MDGGDNNEDEFDWDAVDWDAVEAEAAEAIAKRRAEQAVQAGREAAERQYKIECNSLATRSQEAFIKAKRIYDDQVKGKLQADKKAVASDGIKTLSGWGDTVFRDNQGFTTKYPDEVLAYSADRLQYQIAKHEFDQGKDGSYYASHAEKQLAVSSPNEPIGVIWGMCEDCQKFFRMQAIATGQPQAVTDPYLTRIFHPNGRVEEIKHNIK
jgi:hypothetical protein